MNENTVKGKWNEIKADIQKAWGKLTEADLDDIKHNMSALGDKLQEKYEMTKEQAREKIDELKAKLNLDGDRDFDAEDEDDEDDAKSQYASNKQNPSYKPDVQSDKAREFKAEGARDQNVRSKRPDGNGREVR